MLNYYQILELEDFAAKSEIKSAYRKKCLEYHPDRTSTLGGKLQQIAESEMIIINKAYDILGDESRKAKFDDWLRTAEIRKTLRPCRHCGLHFDAQENPSYLGICPICSNQKVSVGDIGTEDEGQQIGAEELLRNCFIVLHHFVASSTVQTFNPNVYMMVNGEVIIASTPSQSLEVSISNRRKFDLVCSGSDIFKHKWNKNLGLGRITFTRTHPVDSAKTLWDFCIQLFGKPVLEYCRLEINNEDFKPYEHVLNQSVIVLASEVSPWNASKIFSRHRRNLIAAVNDPETFSDDPFISVMAGSSDKGSTRISQADMDDKSHLLQSSLLATKEKLNEQKRNIQAWNNQVADLLEEISWLKTKNNELSEENKRLKDTLQNSEPNLNVSREHADKIKVLEAKNSELQKLLDKLSRLPAESGIAIPASPEDGNSTYTEIRDLINLLLKKNAELKSRSNVVNELIALSNELEEQNQILMDQNRLVGDFKGKSRQSQDSDSGNLATEPPFLLASLFDDLKNSLQSIIEDKVNSVIKSKILSGTEESHENDNKGNDATVNKKTTSSQTSKKSSSRKNSRNQRKSKKR